MSLSRSICFAWALIAIAAFAQCNGEEACTAFEDAQAAAGESLLQKMQSRDPSLLELGPEDIVGNGNQRTNRPELEPPPALFDLLQVGRGDENVTTTRPVLEPPPHLFDLLDVSPQQTMQDDTEERLETMLEAAGYSAKGYQGAPGCVPFDVESRRQQSALFMLTKDLQPIGVTASLDAQGFLATTSSCCPHEMEQFFVRLLQARGLDVCSKPHIQGLMHWFSCVPDMDFQYVIEVIDKGNPCKYWAPKGETCPKLSVQCAGEYCGAAKPAKPMKNTTTFTTTTTTTTTTNACEGDVELEFWKATKTHNNVGGKGPDSGDEYMRISGLGNVQGTPFDLLVSSTSDRYETPEGFAQYNGVYGYFGYLTMTSGSAFDIKFQFVEANTTTPIVLPKFYFTFFDIDTSDPTNTDRSGGETVSCSGYEQYFVGPNATDQLEIEKDDKGRDQFQGTKYGTGADNPKDPLKLTDLQQNKAVTFQFLETSEFEATYVVSAPPPLGSAGRDIYFAGKSQLALNPCFGKDAFAPTTLAPSKKPCADEGSPGWCQKKKRKCSADGDVARRCEKTCGLCSDPATTM